MLQQKELAEWNSLNNQFPSISLKRLFDDQAIQKFYDMIETNIPDQPVHHINFPFTYYSVECSSQIEREGLAKAFSTWSIIESAYTENGFVPCDPLLSQQGYLNAAPVGIDARFVWEVPGGRGGNLSGSPVKFADVEAGWNLSHEDFAASGIRLRSGVNLPDPADQAHGTAVLGVVMAQSNSTGGIGITPRVQGSVFSTYRGSGTFDLPNAILDAAHWLSTPGRTPGSNIGNVMLLPLAAFQHSTGRQPAANVPIETVPVIRDLIHMCVHSLNIVVIATAGSGDIGSDTGINLNKYINSSGRQTLNPSSPDFFDTGAIIVGAASSAAPHTRIRASNYGRRVTCYAWGENIVTTGGLSSSGGSSTYITNFGRTSGAAAIVAGAAISAQGMARARGFSLTPSEMKNILSDPDLNTHSASPFTDRIGVMPDLKKIAEHILSRPTLPRIDIPREFYTLLGDVLIDGPGIIIGPNGPRPVGPWGQIIQKLSPAKKDMLMGLALTELSALIIDQASRKKVDQAGVDVMTHALQLLQRQVNE